MISRCLYGVGRQTKAAIADRPRKECCCSDRGVLCVILKNPSMENEIISMVP